MFFSTPGTTKPQDCLGGDLAVFTSLVKPVAHPQSQFILEPRTLQSAIKKQTKTKQNKIKTFFQAGGGSTGLKSISAEILPVIVVSCYCIQVSREGKPEHLNNPVYKGGETVNTTKRKRKEITCT